MNAFGTVCDWGLRRLFKLFLKRHLANLLATEVDVEQLRVQLDKGYVELRECYLDTAYLNEILVNYPVELESVLIDKVQIALLPPLVILEDVVVTLRERKSVPRTTTSGALLVANNNLGIEINVGSEDSKTAVREGIRSVFAGLNQILHQVRFDIERLILRMVSAEDGNLVIDLEKASFCDVSTSQSDEPVSWDAIKQCSFSGLALSFNSGSQTPAVIVTGEHGGCNGSITTAWKSTGDTETHLNVDVAIGNGTRVSGCAEVMPAFPAFLGAFATSEASSNNHRNPPIPQFFANEPSLAMKMFEALMLPDGGPYLAEDVATDQSSEEESEQFFDAFSEVQYTSVAVTIEAPTVTFDVVMPSPLENEDDASNLVLCAREVLAVHCQERGSSTTRLWFRTLEAAELVPRSRNLVRTRQRCEAMSGLVQHVPTSMQEWLKDKTAFVQTIRQLEQLRSSTVRPGTEPDAAEYDVLPVFFCHGLATGFIALEDKPAGVIRAILSEMGEEESVTKLSLSMEDIHAWLDAGLINRLQRMVSALSGVRTGTNRCDTSIAPRHSSIEASITSFGVIWMTASGALALRLEGGKEQMLLNVASNQQSISVGIHPLSLDMLVLEDVQTAHRPLFKAHRIGYATEPQIVFTSALSTANLQVGGALTVAFNVPALRAFMALIANSAIKLDEGSRPAGKKATKLVVDRVDLEFSTPSGDAFAGALTDIVISYSVDEIATLTKCSVQGFSMHRIGNDKNFMSGGGGHDPALCWEAIKRLDGKRISACKASYRHKLLMQDIYVKGDLSSAIMYSVELENLFSREVDESERSALLQIEMEARNVLLLYHPPGRADGLRPIAGALVEEAVVILKPSKLLAVSTRNVSLSLAEQASRGVPHNTMFDIWLETHGYRRIASETLIEVSATSQGASVNGVDVSTSCCTITVDKRRFDAIIELSRNIAAEIASTKSAEPTSMREPNPTGASDSSSTTSGAEGTKEKQDLTCNTHGSWGMKDISSSGSSGFRGIMDGDGFWFENINSFSDITLIHDYMFATLEEEWLQGCMSSDAYIVSTCAANNESKQVAFRCGVLRVTMTDSVMPVDGIDLLEGSIESVVKDLVIVLIVAPTADHELGWYLVSSAGAMDVRHCIYPQRSTKCPWRRFIVAPHHGNAQSAIRCHIKSTKRPDHQTLGDQIIVCTSFSPLYLEIDQNCVVFLRDFLSSISANSWQLVDDVNDEIDNGIETEDSWDLTETFIKQCTVSGVALNVSYRPTRFDVLNLRRGSLKEVLNVVPEWKASLWLQGVNATAAEDFSMVCTIVAARWMEDILRSQMHKFVVNLPGVGSAYRVGNAARGFGALPGTASRKDFRRQLHRAVVTFAQAIADESREIRGAMSVS